ncbi:hypothetical protein [Fodinibius sp. SL11]|uniref:hypothetical protein n=1 Tax=Fodinibius sp. SL11 TaxID=3425690 RepID=UPI003F882723
MKKLFSILILGLVSLLTTEAVTHVDYPVENTLSIEKPERENNAQSTHPFEQPNLFNVFHQGETGINISSHPEPWLLEEDREESAIYEFIASATENRLTLHLRIYRLADRTAIFLKYIFPFHAFL